MEVGSILIFCWIFYYGGGFLNKIVLKRSEVAYRISPFPVNFAPYFIYCIKSDKYTLKPFLGASYEEVITECVKKLLVTTVDNIVGLAGLRWS